MRCPPIASVQHSWRGGFRPLLATAVRMWVRAAGCSLLSQALGCPSRAAGAAGQAPYLERVMEEPLRAVDFPEKDLPLRQDVGMLGGIVGDVIREQAGEGLFGLVEAVRGAAISRREARDVDCGALRELVHGLDPAVARELTRAFSTYFQVVNLAEQVHRIRRGRTRLSSGGPPQPGSSGDTVQRLQDLGLDGHEILSLLADVLVEPVFTAHPTEATRRTILEKQRRIAERLIDRLNPARTPREEQALWARIRTEVTSAWQTEEHPTTRPTVAQEREHVLFYLITVLYGVVPVLAEVVEEALEAGFPGYDPGEEARRIGPLVRFASWVGGDMDGNPAVDADSIREALARHQHLILGLYARDVADLIRSLSQSASRVSWSDEVDSLVRRYRDDHPSDFAGIPDRHRAMGYRVLLTLVKARIEATEAGTGGYGVPDELVRDLRAVEDSLEANRGAHAGTFAVRRVRRRVETFGFHMATLDVRQHADVHRAVAARLLGDPEWASRSPEVRAERLRELLLSPSPMKEAGANDLGGGSGANGEVARCLDVFRAIGECQGRYGPGAVGPYIISMARDVDDVLTVLYLASVAGLVDRDGCVPLDVAPLFETVDDLRAAGDTLTDLFSDAAYRPHLARREGRQVVMVGYSDSSKDGGIASARWSLQKAQVEMARVGEESGVSLTVFHGRGGTVSRGGGKVHRAVAASPRGALSGLLRLTEQGEVIDAKYGLPSIALRDLERMVGSVAVKMAEDPEAGVSSDPGWAPIAETVARASRMRYRSLVYDDSRFTPFFRSATPIDVIERMAIGSRPASRKGGGGVEDLRAIPWVFAWTQTRATVPGWFGVGRGWLVPSMPTARPPWPRPWPSGRSSPPSSTTWRWSWPNAISRSRPSTSPWRRRRPGPSSTRSDGSSIGR